MWIAKLRFSLIRLFITFWEYRISANKTIPMNLRGLLEKSAFHSRLSTSHLLYICFSCFLRISFARRFFRITPNFIMRYFALPSLFRFPLPFSRPRAALSYARTCIGVLWCYSPDLQWETDLRSTPFSAKKDISASLL